MALAYPTVQPALKEMFEDEDLSDGSPEFDLLPPRVLGLTGRRLAFGVVQQVVSMRFKGWAIAIGMMDGSGRLRLAPGIVAVHTWKADDVLVIIRRDVPPPQAPSSAWRSLSPGGPFHPKAQSAMVVGANLAAAAARAASSHATHAMHDAMGAPAAQPQPDAVTAQAQAPPPDLASAPVAAQAQLPGTRLPSTRLPPL
jgi:hypothetical protein